MSLEFRSSIHHEQQEGDSSQNNQETNDDLFTQHQRFHK